MINERPNPKESDRLIEITNTILAPLGYEVVYLEVQTHRQKTLRIFIDRLTPSSPIGIEDCVRATRALDEPLESLPEIQEIFCGPYELEVSSPGVDRPLRQAKDYVRFSGQEVRIHVYRPLTGDELGNLGYQSKNPKQKNFLGVLKGLENDRVRLALSASDGTKTDQKGKRPKPASLENEGEVLITIPLPLISKANLEPRFESFDERE